MINNIINELEKRGFTVYNWDTRLEVVVEDFLGFDEDFEEIYASEDKVSSDVDFINNLVKGTNVNVCITYSSEDI